MAHPNESHDPASESRHNSPQPNIQAIAQRLFRGITSRAIFEGAEIARLEGDFELANIYHEEINRRRRLWTDFFESTG